MCANVNKSVLFIYFTYIVKDCLLKKGTVSYVARV